MNANTQAVRKGADNYDFEEYTQRSYKVLNRATQLASDKTLDQATADLMTQLYGNLDIIKTNTAISTADKRAAAPAISRIMTLYSENLFDPKKRSELRSTEQLKSLSKNVNALITENNTALEAVRQKGPEVAQLISVNIEKTNTDLFDDMRTLTTMVQANNWTDWETRKMLLEQEAIQEHAEQEQQMREEHGFKTVEQQKLQEVVDCSPEQYKNVPFLNTVMDILGIDEKQFPEGEFEYAATNGNMVKRDLRKLLGYLTDEKGTTLNADIDAFNKLPDEQRRNNENAKLFAYAMGCKEHLRLGTLLPQYLLDDHNAPRVGNMLSMMNKKKDIDAANEVVGKASKIEWKNGKRSLDSIKDISLYKKQIGSGHHVYQFATNNDHETFKKVFETTLKTMPESLKNIEAENKDGQREKYILKRYCVSSLTEFSSRRGQTARRYRQTSQTHSAGTTPC